VDIKKLGCAVLFTELYPYVHSETKMAEKKQPHAFMEKHQIHTQAPTEHNNCLFVFCMILRDIADAQHLGDLHIKSFSVQQRSQKWLKNGESIK
jgi:hypothetical protein